MILKGITHTRANDAGVIFQRLTLLLVSQATSKVIIKIIFLSFMCEDIGVAVVTNMISQLQESFHKKFIHKMASRCEDGTVTVDFLDELPNFHIDTFSELEEHSGRFAEVSESDVEKFIKGEENANTKKRPTT